MYFLNWYYVCSDVWLYVIIYVCMYIICLFDSTHFNFNFAILFFIRLSKNSCLFDYKKKTLSYWPFLNILKRSLCKLQEKQTRKEWNNDGKGKCPLSYSHDWLITGLLRTSKISPNCLYCSASTISCLLIIYLNANG